MKIKVGKKTPLVTGPLLIEGITRAGKFLLANLVSGIADVEPVQYYGLLEDLPFLDRFGLIEHETAKQVLQCEVDMHCYEMLIGRNFNHRVIDKSSIFNQLHPQKFLKRSHGPDGEVAVEYFRKHNLYSLFITHETMANIGIFFETFPDLKVLHIERNPIELVYSWYKRGMGKRWATDPILFQIPVADEKGAVPWFAYNWMTEYHELGEMDRVIRSITSLWKMSDESYASLPVSAQRRILTVRFEDILKDPKKEMIRMSKFLGKDILPGITKILKREKVPSIVHSEKYAEHQQTIEKLGTKKYVQELLALAKKY